jgi:hypothetical protein
MDGLNSIDRCLSAMGDYPTPEQISALSNAVAKARSQPIPASVDPKGAYGAMLAHLQKAVTAFENGDIATGSSELRSDTAYMQTLQQEMKAAGFDVRP